MRATAPSITSFNEQRCYGSRQVIMSTVLSEKVMHTESLWKGKGTVMRERVSVCVCVRERDSKVWCAASPALCVSGVFKCVWCVCAVCECGVCVLCVCVLCVCVLFYCVLCVCVVYLCVVCVCVVLLLPLLCCF